MSPHHVGTAFVVAILAFADPGCAAPTASQEGATVQAAPSAPHAATASAAMPTPVDATVPAATPAGNSSLRAMVEAVDDTRSTRESAGCRLTLSFFGDVPAHTAAIINTRVNKAEDELGRSLLPNGDRPAAETFGPSLFIRPDYTFLPPLRATVVLRNPSRSATMIKTLDLTVDLYSPTAANGAIIPIAAPLPPAGTDITNAELDRNGIKLVQLTPAEEEREVRSIMGVVPNPTSEPERRRLEAVAAEVARRRQLREAAAAMAVPSGTGSVPSVRPTGAPAEQPTTVPFPSPRPSDSVTIRVTDPNHRLVALQWSDPSGRTIRQFMPVVFSNRASSDGTSTPLRLLRSHEQPRAGWHLVAYVAAEGSVQSHEIHLDNIALP